MIRVVVVSDIRLFCEGLALLLERHGQLAVAETASGGAEALDRVRETAPDVVLVDTAMTASVELVARLVETAPEARVVVLAVPEREEEVISYAEAGVAGYVTREAGAAALIETVESVARGETLCSPRMAATLLRRVRALASERGPARPDAHLTLRELEIVQLIDGGLTNKEIARQLRIEVATVKNHVHNILEKLGVRGRGEAAALVRRHATGSLPLGN